MEELQSNSNPYEQQLFALFKSYDLNKNECLDKRELGSLCEALELDAPRTASLFKALSHVNKVSFSDFKEALLKILDGSAANSSWISESDIDREPSPDREVSPKFVFGEKKYGRRSKPEKGVRRNLSEELNSDEYNETDGFPPSTPLHHQTDAVDISSFKSSNGEQFDSEILNQTEIELRAAWEKLGISTDGFMQQNQFNSLCRALGFNTLSQQEITDLFRKLDTDRDSQISFNELLKLLRNSDLFTSEVTTAVSPEASTQEFQHGSEFSAFELSSPGVISLDVLSELWEAAGLLNAASLLQDLGLSHKSEVNVTQLSVMLEKELATIQRCENSGTYSVHVNLLIASLAVSQFQIKMYRCCLDQMERSQDKLYSDLNAANERATLLAQEVDDHHAKMEKATQQQVKLLEQKHAEQMKQLSTQLLNEREQLREQSLQLEAKLEESQTEENKLKADLSCLQNEYCQIEKENQQLAISVCEKEKLSSQVEVQAREIVSLHERVQELGESNQQVTVLIEKLNQLQTENAMLRDHNDELTVEIESVNRRQLLGTKRRGNSSPCQPKEDGDSPRSGKVRRYTTHNDLSLETSQMQDLAIQPLCVGGGLQVEFDDSVILNSSCEVDSVENNKSSDDDIDAECPQKLSNLSMVIEENKQLRFQLKEIRTTLEDCRTKLSREYSTENIPFDEGVSTKKSNRVTDDIWEENKYLKKQLEEIKLTLNECQTKLAKAFSVDFKDEDLDINNSIESKEKLKLKLKQIQEVFDLLMKADCKDSANETQQTVTLNSFSEEENIFTPESGTDSDHKSLLGINLNEFQSKITKIIEENKSFNQENSVLKSKISNLLTKIPIKEEIEWNINHSPSLKNSSHSDSNISNSTLSSSFTDLSNYAFDYPSKQYLDEGQFCSLDSYKLNKNNLNLASKRGEPDILKTNSNFANNLMASIPKDKTIYVNNLEAELLNKNYKNVEIPNSGISESVQLFMNKILQDSEDRFDSSNSVLHHSIKSSNESNESPISNLNKLRESFQSPVKVWKLATLDAFLKERDELLQKCSKMETLNKENDELNALITKYKNEISEKEDNFQKLSEKCETLEKGIELLKDEYEECENYWNDKLDEERRLFDEEQRISNEKYLELESKIQEYASIFNNSSEESNNLPTIEERGDLEKQFIDLEEEFELYRKRSMVELEERETEIIFLKEALTRTAQVEKTSIEVQTVINFDNAYINGIDDALIDSRDIKSSVPSIKVSDPPEELQSAIEKLKGDRKKLDAECRSLKQRKGDLLRQLSNFQRSNITYSNPYGYQILNAVTSKLYQTEMKCRHLQSALKHQKRQLEKLLNGSWEEHHADLLEIRTTLKTTQEKLAEQLNFTHLQMERLKKSDMVCKDLFVENAKLMEILRCKQPSSCSQGSLSHSI